MSDPHHILALYPVAVALVMIGWLVWECGGRFLVGFVRDWKQIKQARRYRLAREGAK